jgi:hypothetical protein
MPKTIFVIYPRVVGAQKFEDDRNIYSCEHKESWCYKKSLGNLFKGRE